AAAVADPEHEPEELPTPADAGVDPSQALGPTAAPPVPALPSQALAQSELSAAIREAGAAFRGAAPQVLLAHWAEELHRRLDRGEDEIADLRREVADLREEKARLEERAKTVKEKNAADDLLKVGGGAIIGAGVSEMIAGRWVTGLLAILSGLILARFGGASIPR